MSAELLIDENAITIGTRTFTTCAHCGGAVMRGQALDVRRQLRWFEFDALPIETLAGLAYRPHQCTRR